MTSGDILEVLERLSDEALYTDPSDLVVMADLHELFTKTGEWGEQIQCPELVSASALAVNLLETIILEESDCAEVSLRRVMSAAAGVGALVGENDRSLPLPSFDGFAKDEDFAAPGSASEHVDEDVPADVPDRQAAAADAAAESSDFSFETVHLNNNIELLHEFVTEAHEHLENADVHLLTLESEANDHDAINAVFRAFHTIKGVAGFLNVPEIQVLAYESENILDQARKTELVLSGPVIDLIFEAVDHMRHLFDSVENALKSDGYLAPDPQLPQLLVRLERLARGEMPAAPGPEDLDPEPQAKPLGELVVEMDIASGEAVDHALETQSISPEAAKLGELLVSTSILTRTQIAEALALQSRQPDRPLGEILVDLGVATAEEIENALSKQREEPKYAKLGQLLVRSGEVLVRDVARALRAQAKSPGGPTQTIRVAESVKVDPERLDRLVDAVGELVIAKSIVARSLENLSALDENVRVHLGQLDKITQELQEIGMSLRMIPVRQTFQKMSRLVRDLSKKSGKQVEFVLSGEETELDKSIVDKIGDPLVHMVRNAVDHGLETNAEERKKAGKPACGRVELRAYHRGGNIYIDVVDDGRGLDREAILRKAIERGVVKEGDVLTDREVWNLIFEAGFSTAAQVTDVSGRGVGMDVVRRNVESLRGQIEVTSEAGKGTTISIRLPLTLAIIDGMVIRVGSERFILPTLSIVVSLRAKPEQISTVVGQGLVLSHQGRVLPIYRLGQLFNIEDACDDPAEAIIIIVEDEGRRIGLITDELLGKQQIVIKSLGNALGNIPGLAGGAIMPDGQVGLIVDIGGLAKLTHAA